MRAHLAQCSSFWVMLTSCWSPSSGTGTAALGLGVTPNPQGHLSLQLCHEWLGGVSSHRGL